MFSIVVPLYNKEHIVERTVISVLTQTFKDFELIIVNDGSTDSSIEVLKKYLKDPRLKIINQENAGVSSARNRGVLEAKYDYVAFLDADDEWLPGFLEKVKKAIEIFPLAGMFGCTSWHRNIITGESTNSTLNRYKNKIQEINFFENPHIMPHTSAMVVSKFYFDKVKGFPSQMKVCEDWSCFYKIAFSAPLIYIGFPLGIRNNGVQGQITGLNIEERFKLLKHVVDFYNLTFSTWNLSKNKNRDFITFLKYDIRHRILMALKINDYKTINYLFEGLNINIINLFPRFELSMYLNPYINKCGLLYIYKTKLIWRSKGYPISGQI
jgi:glycosyltransferase involved in cell wall biosynthesis